METPQSDLEAIRQLLADLTTRVYRIERRLQIASIEPSSEPRISPTIPPPAQPSNQSLPSEQSLPGLPAKSAPIPGIPPRPTAIPRAQTNDAGLESRIGSHWLNRIGITALLIGISYFLKFAFDNNWIGPAGRVSIGILAGVAIVIWSERFRAKGYKAFSYSLKAAGFGALYLSLWAAFQLYALFPSGVAFVMMLIVTAATAAMALRQDAQILAVFALTGAFSTPLLISTGENREVALFAYVAVLDLATLVLVTFKPWRRLLVMSYAGTLLLYVGWYSRFYGRSELAPTIAFATLFFAVFAIAPLVTLQLEGEAAFFASIPAVIAFVNAAVYFLQAYAMIAEVNQTYMAWFALLLAAVYVSLSRQVRARSTAPGASEILYFLHLAVAIGFVTVAIPIRLDAHWITIGWFVEAGVLLWIGDRLKSDFLNLLALAALLLGVVRLLSIDNFEVTQLLFNLRLATYAVAIAVLGAVVFYAAKRDDDTGRTVAAIALVALNALALVALTREVLDYYARQQVAFQPSPYPTDPNSYSFYKDLHRLDIERDFAYSALWMAYGAMLMVVGFLRRSAFVRWQALVLIAATTVKVFIYDVSQLDKGYRIVSFIVLGVLLLAISFVYQRDWLQLSKKQFKPETDANA